MDQVRAINLLFAGYLYVRMLEKRRKKRKKRSVGVREIYRKRLQFQDVQNLIEEMRLGDSEQFFAYMRMNVERFNHLLQLVGPHLKRRDMYTVLTPTQRLAMTLRFLAAGDSRSTLSFAYRCSTSTVCGILSATTKALISVLKPLYLKSPSTADQWRKIAADFWEQWQFPQCIGALDAKRIEIQIPYIANSASNTNFFSIILLGACDADYNFTLVDIGAERCTSDGAVLSKSKLGKRLHENTLGLPGPAYLPDTTVKMPYFFVADTTFPLKNYVMRPYGGRDVPFENRIFNYRLSRARRIIENAFGILTARWRIYQRPFGSSLENADCIIESTICLHNYIQKAGDSDLRARYCPAGFVDSELSDGVVVVEGEWRRLVARRNGAMVVGPRMGSNNATTRVMQQRDRLRDFVNGPAALPFQNQIVEGQQGIQ